jgi:hypothetical protein
MASRIPALPRDSHVQSHAAVHKNKLCDSHTLCAAAVAIAGAGIGPVAGIDERLPLGGSLAYETAHYWQAATQAGRETQRCAEH